MSLTRRTFIKNTAALLATIGLPAWAVEELTAQAEPSLMEQLFLPSVAVAGDHIIHLLNRTTYGATTAEVARIRNIGIAAYLDEQLHPERIDDRALETRLVPFKTLQMNGAQLLQQEVKQVVAELIGATLLRARWSRKQLQEVLVDFWSNHFNVFIGKGNCRYFKTLDDRDAIRPHVLGRFRDLLGASAKSPAMLVFLDNRQNRKQAPNENYARELMELHTMGVDSPFTEDDVLAVARCFTGWTIRDGAFFFARGQHDNEAKTVLGMPIKANGGIKDGEQVLDILAEHPSTAQFIATKLCRRFVSDQPPATVVERVATTFRTTNGDLREVMRTLLQAPEFAVSQGQKLRRPLDYVLGATRALNADIEGVALPQRIRLLDQPLFGAGAPNGYPDVAGAWLNSSGLLGRWNFALDLAHGNIKGVSFDLAKLVTGTATAQARAERLVTTLLPGQNAPTLVAQLAKFLGGPAASPQQLTQRTPTAVGLLLGAPLSQYR